MSILRSRWARRKEVEYRQRKRGSRRPAVILRLPGNQGVWLAPVRTARKKEGVARQVAPGVGIWARSGYNLLSSFRYSLVKESPDATLARLAGCPGRRDDFGREPGAVRCGVSAAVGERSGRAYEGGHPGGSGP